MRHCCKFDADDTYYLRESNLYTTRKLSIGCCPICNKPIAELFERRFDGVIERHRASGIEAHNMMLKLKDQISYSIRQFSYSRAKSSPYGWKYGINKLVKIKGKENIRQYACDFYGNKEIIKIVK